MASGKQISIKDSFLSIIQRRTGMKVRLPSNRFRQILWDCTTWKEMSGNGVRTIIGPTIISIVRCLTQKGLKILMILRSQTLKNVYNGEDLFFAMISIANVIKLEAEAKVMSIALPITSGFVVLKISNRKGLQMQAFSI